MLVSIDSRLQTNRENVIKKAVEKGLSLEEVTGYLSRQCLPIKEFPKVGFYQSETLDISPLFRPDPLPDYDMPSLYDNFPSIGVTSSPEHLFKQLPHNVVSNLDNNQFVVNMVKLIKAEQKPIGGARLNSYANKTHKNELKRTLYEEDMEAVWRYMIFYLG